MFLNCLKALKACYETIFSVFAVSNNGTVPWETGRLQCLHNKGQRLDRMTPHASGPCSQSGARNEVKLIVNHSRNMLSQECVIAAPTRVSISPVQFPFPITNPLPSYIILLLSGLPPLESLQPDDIPVAAPQATCLSFESVSDTFDPSTLEAELGFL